MNLQPFSESISTAETFGYKEQRPRGTTPGMTVSPTQKETSRLRRMKLPEPSAVLRRRLLSKPIQNALGVLETVKDNRLTFMYPTTTDPIVITKNLFRKSQRVIVENIKYIDPEDLKGTKELLKIRYPVERITVATAKPLAEKAAKKALEKEGAKVTAKTLAKYARKFIPIIRIVGYIAFAAWLTKYWKKGKTFSEGEYYHKDIGWY